MANVPESETEAEFVETRVSRRCLFAAGISSFCCRGGVAAAAEELEVATLLAAAGKGETIWAWSVFLLCGAWYHSFSGASEWKLQLGR